MAQRTLNGKMTPQTHPPPTAKSPKPPLHLLPLLAPHLPPFRYPFLRLWKHRRVAVHTVRVSAHLDAARDIAVAVDGGAVGAERGDARLLSQRRCVETERLLEEVV